MASAAPRQGISAEYAFMLIIVGGVGYHIYFFLTQGYLAAPFFYETYDTWMDWFNTSFWARESGTYDVWRTIYPPLPFLFLKVFGIDACYTGPVEARECDWVGIVTLHGFYLLNVVLIGLTYRKIDRATALPRTIALAAGMPMLFALERGNLILVCFTCLILSFGPLLRSARLRWLFAGLAVNFKIYLIAAVIAQLLRRRWVAAEAMIIATTAIYVTSYLGLGSGSPGEIIGNIATFAESFQSGQVLDIWYPSTYQPVLNLLSGMNFPTIYFLGSHLSELGLVFFPIITYLGQGAIVAAAVATWLRPEKVPPYRTALLAITLALITTEASGYTQISMVLFVLMERWRGIARPVAIVAAYLLCVPLDYMVIDVPPFVSESFLANHAVEAHYGVGIGVFLRPGLMVVIGVALSCATIHDVWGDLREQGWRDRWRFRSDAPVLPGVEAPLPRPDRPDIHRST